MADLITVARCGLEEDRDMLKIYARSALDMNRLAQSILEERARFRKAPAEHRARRPRKQEPNKVVQMKLLGDGVA